MQKSKKLLSIVLSLIMLMSAVGGSVTAYAASVAAPTGVTAKATSSSTIKISWKKVKGASGYYLYRSTSKNGKYKKVATIKKGSTLSQKDTKLKANKKYYYKLKAYKSSKTSKYSKVVCVKTKKLYYEGDRVSVTGTVVKVPAGYKGSEWTVYYLELSSPIDAKLVYYPNCDANIAKYIKVKSILLSPDKNFNEVNLKKYVGKKVKVTGNLFGLDKGYLLGWETKNGEICKTGIENRTIKLK